MVATVVALLAAGGCASGHLASGSAFSGRDLITGKDIARWPAGSAQRAFVAWWRDAQYANVSAVAKLVTMRPVPAQAVPLVDALSSLMQSARPTSLVALKRRGGANLRVTVTVHQPVGAGTFVDQRLKLTVPLLGGPGSWRVTTGYAWAQALADDLRPLTGGNRG
ncbi:MAG: hypothetical protein U0T02_08600 [Solirubrobacteraceae bacterium]